MLGVQRTVYFSPNPFTPVSQTDLSG